MIRSLDYEEFTLLCSERSNGLGSSSTGNIPTATTTTTLFKGAKCYGFRNLQNLVRKVGREAGVQVGRGAAGRLPASSSSSSSSPSAFAFRGRGRLGKKGENEGIGAGGGGGGYDYVEVMACPGGCVNGGGQLRPPPLSSTPPTRPHSGNGMDVDEEGFKRDWEGQGVSLGVGVDGEGGGDGGGGGQGQGQGQGGKWGDKEWIKKVEERYWDGSPPPPPPPPSLSLTTTTRRSPNEKERKLVASANTLAAQILKDLCHPSSPQNPKTEFKWTSQMDPQAESKRHTYFRTQYRAIETEVVGLAVKW